MTDQEQTPNSRRTSVGVDKSATTYDSSTLARTVRSEEDGSAAAQCVQRGVKACWHTSACTSPARSLTGYRLVCHPSLCHPCLLKRRQGSAALTMVPCGTVVPPGYRRRRTCACGLSCSSIIFKMPRIQALSGATGRQLSFVSGPVKGKRYGSTSTARSVERISTTTRVIRMYTYPLNVSDGIVSDGMSVQMHGTSGS
jgi:hypothetical protein